MKITAHANRPSITVFQRGDARHLNELCSRHRPATSTARQQMRPSKM